MNKKNLALARKKTIDELKKSVSEKSKKILIGSVRMSVGKEKNLKKVKNLKIEVAQLLTIIREKQLADSKKIETKTK